MSTLKVDGIRSNSATSDAITLADNGTCTANITNNLSNRNLIINGAMQVAQRGTSATNIGTTGTFVVDRFLVSNVTGTAVQTATQENDAPAGFYNSLKVTCTTADTNYSTDDQSKIEYRIEGKDIQRLNFGTANAKTLGVSFYVKSNKTGNTAIGLVNSANDRSFVHQFTIASANTWQRVSFTVAGDTSGTWLVDTNIGMRLRWGTFGTNFQTSTLDAWQAGQKMATSNSPINFNAATNDYLQITGVQLEVGSVATDFEHRSYGQELALCQRYCYVISDGTLGMGAQKSSTQIIGTIAFPVTMRTAPTATSSDLALRIDSGVHLVTSSSGTFTLTEAGPVSTGYKMSGYTSLSSGSAFFVKENAGSITLSAEL